MNIELVCFTDRGEALGGRLLRELLAAGDGARLERCGGDGQCLNVAAWAAENFSAADALVFIGAAGIAVRAVAPLLMGKTKDPAVVVIDDCGRFAVSLVSGHLGGANALAGRLAALIGALPVVTTATDGAGVFAIDNWAKERGLFIANPECIKRVSARALAGRAVRLRSAFPAALPEELPDGVVPAAADGADVVIDIFRSAPPDVLLLVPPVAVLGAGCRRGVSAEAVEEAFQKFCGAAGIVPQAFRAVCSIDVKKDEAGLSAFCAARALPFAVFSAEELARAEGEFSGSGFVASVVGVDNVCERAAVVGSGDGALVAGKFARGGVTMAAAVGDFQERR